MSVFVLVPKLARLTGCDDLLELGFMEREATPKPAMKPGIQLHLAGLSLLDTVAVLTSLGIDCCRTTVYDWIQKADLQPTKSCRVE